MAGIDPTELTKQPTDVTECPYILTMSRQALQQQQVYPYSIQFQFHTDKILCHVCNFPSTS